MNLEKFDWEGFCLFANFGYAKVLVAKLNARSQIGCSSAI